MEAFEACTWQDRTVGDTVHHEPESHAQNTGTVTNKGNKLLYT